MNKYILCKLNYYGKSNKSDKMHEIISHAPSNAENVTFCQCCMWAQLAICKRFCLLIDPNYIVPCKFPPFVRPKVTSCGPSDSLSIGQLSTFMF